MNEVISESYHELTDERLVVLVRAGDRSAAAEFTARYEDLIRARIRRRLSSHVRRLFDSQEVFSSTARRLDRFVSSNQAEPLGVEQLIALMTRIAERVVVDKARIVKSFKRAEDGWLWPDAADQATATAEPDLTEALTEAFEQLPETEDRDILSLFLQGKAQVQIAKDLDLPKERVWWRWRRIRESLRNALEGHRPWMS
ncbi:MAG: ECF-type sigma factor [Planctomycetota bacterium]